MLLIAFQALLRTGELLAFRPCDIIFHGLTPSSAGSPSAISALGLTQSGARRGEAEDVVVDDARLVRWLQALCAPETRPSR
jgi:hypothetical protein